MRVQGHKHLGHLLLLSLIHYQGAGSELEQMELDPETKRNARCTGDGLRCYATILAPITGVLI